MTRLYLIRHGHYLGMENPDHGIDPDAPLDELGQAQIEQLAERLKDETIKVVFTSELRRARMSGEIIASHLHLPVKVTPVLNEIGFFIEPRAIMTFERDEKLYQQAVRDVSRASTKAIKFLEEVADEHQGETLAVVCHGNIIRAILGRALRADVDSIIRLEVDLASLSVLEYDGADLFRLIKLNDTSHLKG